MTGDYVTVTIPKGVKIISLKYRDTSYDTDIVGSFNSADLDLQTLWAKAARSLYVNMRDVYTDCPDRERGAWIADATTSMEVGFYSLDEKSHALGIKTYRDLVGWSQKDGRFLTVSPAGIEYFELPMQNLAAAASAYNYYLYTGNEYVLSLTYDVFKKYLERFGADNGLVDYQKGTWDWPDWGIKADNEVMENALFYAAIKNMEKSALVLGKTEDAASFSARAAGLYAAFNQKYWKGSYYSSGIEPDDRANALAVTSGLASYEKFGGIANILETVFNSSPYMEKFVLEALIIAGYPEKALERMKARYSGMIASEDSTLWEFWDRRASVNHSWGGSPLMILGKYYAGISPDKAGYESFNFAPVSGISDFTAVVPTVRGNIAVAKTNGDYYLGYAFGAEVNVTKPESGKVFVNGTEL